MPDCALDILDLPVNSSLIDPEELVMFTLPDGTTFLRKWSTVIGSTAPADIDFQVGVTIGAPGDGATTYTNAALIAKRVRLYRGGFKQSQLALIGGYGYSFNNLTGTITPSPAFMLDEVWSIEIY